jgi:hypothetical protein
MSGLSRAEITEVRRALETLCRDAAGTVRV